MDFAMQADGATSVVSALDPVLDPVSVKPRYKQDRRPRLTQVNMNFRLGRRIRYSGSWDNTIRLWDAAAGVEIARLETDAPIVPRPATIWPDRGG